MLCLNSNRNFDFFVEFGVLIVFKFEIVDGEVVEVLYVLVHFESRRRVLRILQNFLYDGNMTVVNMRVAYDVYEFADFKSAHLREHMKKHGVLHDVPVVCREGVLASLVQNAVEFVSRDVERHRVRARVEVHFVQVLEVVDVGEYAPRLRIVFKVVKHSVHLVEFAFGIYALFAELIAVRLADRARFVRPTVPDMRIEVVHVVALFLPNPKNLVDCGFESGAAKGDNRKLFCEVVSVDDTELLYCVRRRSVKPLGAHFEVFVADSVVEYVAASFDKYLICEAHSFTFCIVKIENLQYYCASLPRKRSA